MRKRTGFCLAALLLCAFASHAIGDEQMDCLTDKAMYAPGETVVCQVTGAPENTACLRVSLTHLEAEPVLCFTVRCEEALSFTLPETDFTGYLLTVQALDEKGKTLALCRCGVDCSSVWTRFPRYGYVWDFTKGADAEGKISAMTRMHLNGVQFYDWQYRHHIPVSPDLKGWKDWTGRLISGDVLNAYIGAAHARGMACLAYNMIYAANETYLTDGSGVDPAWRLVRANGVDFTCEMDKSLGAVGVLQFFNPLNDGWQRYIFEREREVFSAFAFDGWHGDTIGEAGRMCAADGGPLGYDAEGKPIHLVKNCYTQFLNAAKAAIGENKYLVFNPVGAQGLENVCVSDVDVLYAEFWPWDKNADGIPYVSYASIKEAIEEAARLSGGKSLIVAAYVNYRNSAPYFNAPAVRLMDCVTFAAGGARIELGNGANMLSDEYFPADHNKRMDEKLQCAVTGLYDFAVAYENLLRDGQTPVSRTVLINDQAAGTQGQADQVWCFARADAEYEIYHFINLTGTDAVWRDEAQTKNAPTVLQSLKTRLYTDFDVKRAFLASPDGDDIAPNAISFTLGQDERGRYIELTMPELRYWNMIFLR